VLGNNAFKPELAGMGEDRRALAFKVLAVLHPGPRLAKQLLQLGLAVLKRPGTPVLAIELEQVEGV
jgi:hypothetical protein